MNKNKSCTVEPIRKRQDIAAIKHALADNPRDLALFTMGIHAGLRGSDLLALRWCDVLTADGAIKKVIEVNESKTGKLRRIAVSPNMRLAISAWREAMDWEDQVLVDAGIMTGLLFPNGNGKAMSIQRLHQLVNEWTRKAGLQGHFGSHTLRKTYGYHLRKRGTDLPTLMRIFSHECPSVTLRYLGVDNDEIDEANLRLNL
ncbi:MAG: tyrosine-type recombinase/integrase [Verrucomicrobiia bacterium]